MNRPSKILGGLLLVAGLTFAVAACGDDSGTSNNPPAQAPTTAVTQSTEAMTDSTEAMTDSTDHMTETTEAMTDSTEAMTDSTTP